MTKEINLKGTHCCDVYFRAEWKKLRNRYLNMQRKQMKELKQHLNRARFSNQNYDDENSMQSLTNGEIKKETANKLELVPGVIVKVKLTESCHDVKKTKVSSRILQLYFLNCIKVGFGNYDLAFKI